jgi:serine/threonine-protein kinase
MAETSWRDAATSPRPRSPGPSGASFEAESERLRTVLAEQIERDALREARETVVALLCLRPNDPDALSARAFLDDQLSAAGNSSAGECRRLDGHGSAVNCVAFAPDGRRAISGSGGTGMGDDLQAREDRSIRLWDTETGQELRRLVGLTSTVTGVAFAGDGRHFLSGHRAGSLYFWDANSASMVRRFQRRVANVQAVALTANGRWAVSGGDDTALHLWEVATGRSVRRYRRHKSAVTALTISSNGQLILSGSADKSVRLWELDSGRHLRRLDGHLLTVACVAIAPDNRHALSAGSESDIFLWDLENGKLVRRFHGHTGAVQSVAFSRDGTRALSGSSDNTMRLWEVATGRELHCFFGHKGAVTSVAFAPTGALVALSGSRDTSLRLWQLPGVVVSGLSTASLPELGEVRYASVGSLVQALTASALLDAKQREDLATNRQQRFSSPRALLLNLVEHAWLTAFQAQQIAEGCIEDLVLGSYVVLDRLGEGSMGEVFKARPTGSQDIVVLKVVRPDLLANETITQQFMCEIQTLSRLSHPNIIKTFGAYHHGSRHFFTMEYIEGTDLGRLVQNSGALPIAQACDYIRQAALGLEHAHEHCLVHRDIKPANLLLTLPPAARDMMDVDLSVPAPKAIIKVIDWGLADRRLPTGHQANLNAQSPKGEMVGTADYLAPEQAQDASKAGIQADIYSLGCTLYHLLTGQPPFPGGSLMQKLMKHRQAEPQPLQDLRPEIPAGITPIVKKMMAKKLEHRYRTPAMVAAALAAFSLPS